MKYIYLINNKDIFEKVMIDNEKEILEEIYYLKYKIPSNKDISKSSKEIKNFFEENKLEEIKKIISKVKKKIPLFNVYHYNLYLIDKENVFSYITYKNYRFPDNITINNIKKKSEELTSEDEVTKRRKKKIKLMLYFLDQFDYNELFNSYMSLYLLSNPYYINPITTCEKPSFISKFKHMNPYYTRLELINLAKNMNINLNNEYLNDPEKVNEVCKIINDNDINKKILLNHYNLINKNDMVNLVAYYTIQGSEKLNNYLRNNYELNGINYEYRNKLLEKTIDSLYLLINKSSKFDKDYYVYRFVDSNFLENLNIGDIFIEKGFLSTTRNPFYVPKNYNFGKILIKIKIPKNKEGIALCIETVSKYPEEEEIIFSPNTKLKLISKNENFNYYHIDEKYQNSIKIKYEFEYICCTGKPKYNEKKIYNEKKVIDFDTLSYESVINFNDLINIFSDKYLDIHNCFYTKINKKEIYLIFERFDSTGSYNKFYSLNTSNGISFYSFYKNSLLFFIEICEKDDTRLMNVNYFISHLGYSNFNREDIINDREFLLFLSKIGKYFSCDYSIIYSDFVECKLKNNKSDKYGYVSKDVYEYLKFKKKRFDKISKTNIYPQFSYYLLDELKNIKPLTILDKNDNDELYQVFIRNYPHNDKNNNLNDFFIWICDNYCDLLNILINKFDKLYENPFLKISYKYNIRNFLYNESQQERIKTKNILYN